MTDREARVWVIHPDGTFRPGFYRCRLVKNGPIVPVVLAEIAPDRDDAGEWLWDFIFHLTVDGEERDPYTHKPFDGEPITEAELRYLEATRAYDRQHDTPLADARKRIDPLTSPLSF